MHITVPKKPKERAFQRELINSIHAQYPGSLIRQAQDVATFHRKQNTGAPFGTGFPDLAMLVMRPVPNLGGTKPFPPHPVCEYWECKVGIMPTKKPFRVLRESQFNAEQQIWLHKLALAGQRIYGVVLLWKDCNSDSHVWRIPLQHWDGSLKLDWTQSELSRCADNPEWFIVWDAVKKIWRV